MTIKVATTEELVKAASDAYDAGADIISDTAFDSLEVDHGLDVTIDRYRRKVDHIMPMGSLRKIKENPEGWDKWIKSQTVGCLVITPKLDGNSIEVIYQDGKLVEASSRGDGFVGNDITDKIVHCNVPLTIDRTGHFVGRAEAVMHKSEQDNHDSPIRSIGSGHLMRKTAKPSDLAKIDIIFFNADFDEPLTINAKYCLMKSIFGYHCVDHHIIPIAMEEEVPGELTTKNLTWEVLQKIFEDLRDKSPYTIDGIVVERLETALSFAEKPAMEPIDTIAVKFEGTSMEGEIGSHIWRLKKFGVLSLKVRLKDSVSIDGTDVWHATGHNFSWAVNKGCGIGAQVMLIKAGEIIPQISEVLEPSTTGFDIMPNCPACGTPAILNANKVQAICPNEDCQGGGLVVLEHVLGLMEIDGISGGSYAKLYEAGYETIADVFAMSDHDMKRVLGPSKGETLHLGLMNTEITEARAIKMALIRGIGESTAVKLLDHYGSITQLISSVTGNASSLHKIDGIGHVLMNNIIDALDHLENFVATLKTVIEITPHEIKTVSAEADHVAVTGKWIKGRKEIQTMLEDAGHVFTGGISGTTTVLLCANPDAGTGKLKKAAAKGISVRSYDDYMTEKGLI